LASAELLLTYPLMDAIQEISGRIGRVTGHGIAGNVCRNFLAPFIWTRVTLLLVANTINIAADLGAITDSTKLLIGGWSPIYVVIYAVGSVTAQIFFSYKRYVAILKWLTLVLFAYVIALAIVHVPWGEALRGLLIHDSDRYPGYHDLALPFCLAIIARGRRSAG
jgi:Mn2+/Fe2+ NRAMP family transporter